MIKYKHILRGTINGEPFEVEEKGRVALHIHDAEAAKELFEHLYDDCAIEDIVITPQRINIKHELGECEFVREC